MSNSDAEDAARYRWLAARVRGTNVYEQSDHRGRFIFPNIAPVGDVMRGSVAQHLDEAIDSLMAKEKKLDAIEPRKPWSCPACAGSGFVDQWAPPGKLQVCGACFGKGGYVIREGV